MKTGNKRIEVIFLGRYNANEILSGPEKTAKRIFHEHTKAFASCFIQYFFDGNKYGLYQKFFGRENTARVNNSEVLTLGLFPLFFALIKLKPKIIHIITFERFAVTAFLYRLFHKTKIIYNAHGIVAHENNELKKVGALFKFKDKICEKMFLRYSDRIIFNSEISMDICEKYFKLDEYKAVILSGGTDERFSISYRNRNNKNTGPLKMVILHQNALHNSSIEFFLECSKTITYPADIYIIGNVTKQDFGSLQAKINYLPKLDTEELCEFYKDKHIFLSLNKYNTFSISTIEAMAAGLVPVVTEETGMTRYIVNGENGFTVKYGDLKKLEQILEYLNSDRELIRSISSNASKIYDILSWQQVYETYNNIYLVVR